MARGAGKSANLQVAPPQNAEQRAWNAWIDKKVEYDRAVATLFVNPKQFNNPSDLAAYPRREREDLARVLKKHTGIPNDTSILTVELGGVFEHEAVGRLYDALVEVTGSPVVELNRAVAVGMAEGPDAGLALLDTLADDDRVREHHRLAAVRAHLLERAGRPAEARAAYLDAARRTTSLPERRYLDAKAAALTPHP